MIGLSLLFGTIVGLSLGLTGGGGAIFAVPLLVYGLTVAPQDAVGISLAAVGATALIGALQRLRAHEVDLATGVLFALAGMVGAPLGAWLNARLPGALLLMLFALLMLVVAVRMWRRASPVPGQTSPLSSACARDEHGRLILTSHCVLTLIAVGLLTGILSGLFGVGGGFIIVPALVLVSGMAMHRAVATSLVVITLVSVSGVLSYLIAGRPVEWMLTGLFAVGGIIGMTLGTQWSRRLSGPILQQGFAVALVVVAAFVITRNLW
jgi:uncharacterized membrane protein YfcA